MLEFVSKELKVIEESIDQATTRSDIFRKLRSLSLSDFGLLLLTIPNPDFPKLSGLLPRMATEEIQRRWTGSAGRALLTQTTDFVRSVAHNFTQATGSTLQDKSILDFGCGYGRIARLMYYFTDEDNFFGVDPSEKSLKICHADGLTKNFLFAEYLPSTLPVEKKTFDLIFAFSVFTHLSESATTTCLNTLAKYLKPDGLLAISIRPIEYWDLDKYAKERDLIGQQKSLHRDKGFSFLPHTRPTVGGDVIYGDTSMTLDWIRYSFPHLKIVGVDRSLNDPYQIYVFIQKS